jgi:hypothetical protein
MTATVPDADFRTYYDRPVLKEPVWTWEVPAYFFTGGLAAGSALVAAAADLTGEGRVARAAHVTAAAGALVGTALLVSDLGRPRRFHHMLRVAKVTSPMSVGSWTLALFSAAAVGAAGSHVTGRATTAGKLAGAVAAALAPAVATYPAALVANTAVPAWHEGRRLLPFLSAGGSAASAGALGVLVDPASRASQRLMLLGVAAEVGTAQALEHTLPDGVGAAYGRGRAGTLARASLGMTIAGAAIGTRRRGRRLGALLVGVGAAIERYAVMAAGRESARDPAFTVAPQRQRAQPA